MASRNITVSTSARSSSIDRSTVEVQEGENGDHGEERLGEFPGISHEIVARGILAV